MLSLIESAREEALVERRHRSLVVDREPSSFNPGLASDLTCLHVDCFHGSWVSHHGVARLSHLQKLHSSVRLRHTSARYPVLGEEPGERDGQEGELYV